jgi:hypothetical protein
MISDVLAEAIEEIKRYRASGSYPAEWPAMDRLLADMESIRIDLDPLRSKPRAIASAILASRATATAASTSRIATIQPALALAPRRYGHSGGRRIRSVDRWSLLQGCGNGHDREIVNRQPHRDRLNPIFGGLRQHRVESFKNF